jgi:hypothetical protein
MRAMIETIFFITILFHGSTVASGTVASLYYDSAFDWALRKGIVEKWQGTLTTTLASIDCKR